MKTRGNLWLTSMCNAPQVTLQNEPKGFCSAEVRGNGSSFVVLSGTLLKSLLVTVVTSHLGVFNMK